MVGVEEWESGLDEELEKEADDYDQLGLHLDRWERYRKEVTDRVPNRLIVRISTVGVN